MCLKCNNKNYCRQFIIRINNDNIEFQLCSDSNNYPKERLIEYILVDKDLKITVFDVTFSFVLLFQNFRFSSFRIDFLVLAK